MMNKLKTDKLKNCDQMSTPNNLRRISLEQNFPPSRRISSELKSPPARRISLETPPSHQIPPTGPISSNIQVPPAIPVTFNHSPNKITSSNRSSTIKTSLITHGLPSGHQMTVPSTVILINDQYILGKKLGYGSFGEVFHGTDVKTRQSVAIKMEPLNSEHQILSHEYQVYQDIYQPGCDLCQIHYFGVEDDFTVLVMDALGESLNQLLNRQPNAVFSLKTTLLLADQMLTRLEYLHSFGYVHRDLKPENFLMGLGYQENKVHLIDYGLAKRYRMGNKHISFKSGNKLVGTARYASLNSHLGIRLSRRDDLESLVYIMIYFLNGSLPWQSLKGRNKEEKYQNIMKIKATISTEQLCKGLPIEIRHFLDHVKSLEFVEKPNYQYLRGLLHQSLNNAGFQYDLEL